MLSRAGLTESLLKTLLKLPVISIFLRSHFALSLQHAGQRSSLWQTLHTRREVLLLSTQLEESDSMMLTIPWTCRCPLTCTFFPGGWSSNIAPVRLEGANRRPSQADFRSHSSSKAEISTTLSIKAGFEEVLMSKGPILKFCSKAYEGGKSFES